MERLLRKCDTHGNREASVRENRDFVTGARRPEAFSGMCQRGATVLRTAISDRVLPNAQHRIDKAAVVHGRRERAREFSNVSHELNI